MADLEGKKEALAVLDSRLAAGEIDAVEYERLRGLLTSGLSQVQQASLGVTPAPLPRSVQSGAIGPSSGATRLPNLTGQKLEPGTVLMEQWKVVSELGRGGFGAVYEVEDVRLGRTLALKVLNPSMVANEALLARFRREVTLMRELVNERIVRVFDYREDPDENLALITMEFIRGCTVRDLPARAKEAGQNVPVRLAVEILRQTFEGLAAAESKGVIHRDITPGNILLAGGTSKQLLADPATDPEVRLADFGIAGLAEPSDISQQSRVLGTAAYVAPEVLDPDADVTSAVDVYGAGAVAYELLTGKPPVVTGNRPLAEYEIRVDSEIATLISRTISLDPRQRPSPSEAVQQLESYSKRHPEASCGESQQLSTSKARQTPGQRPLKLDHGVHPLSGDSPPQHGFGQMANGSSLPSIPSSDEGVGEIEKQVPRKPTKRVLVIVLACIVVAVSLVLIVLNLNGGSRTAASMAAAPTPPLPLVTESAVQVVSKEIPQERSVAQIPTESVSQSRSIDRQLSESVIEKQTPVLTNTHPTDGELAPFEPVVGMRFRFVPTELTSAKSIVHEAGNQDGDPIEMVGTWFGEKEVTQHSWIEVMGSNPSRFVECGAHCPVERTSILDAMRFANRLSDREGIQRCYQITDQTIGFVGCGCRGYRLPTEREWLSATRKEGTAFETDQYALQQMAWLKQNSGGSSKITGLKNQNSFGLVDMLGNVREYVWGLDGSTVMVPIAVDEGLLESDWSVTLGGGWNDDSTLPLDSFRTKPGPEERSDQVGFRLVRTAD